MTASPAVAETTHKTVLGCIKRPPLAHRYAPSCTCGQAWQGPPTADIEDAQKWQRAHLSHVENTANQRAAAADKKKATT